MKKVFLLFLCSFLTLQAQPEVTSLEVFKTINERLSYMEDVATYKANNHIAIEDIQREKIVVEKAKEFGSGLGFEPEIIEDFFYAQISVAKAIQYRYRAELLSHPSNQKPRDLQKVIRPALIRLGNRIMELIAAYCKKYGKFNQAQFTEFKEAITVKYVKEADKELLFRVLLKIKL